MIFRRRTAISYIMSVAIMTFVTLAMASVVLVWSLGQTATSQNTFASAINANEAKAEERYTIEQVQFLASGQSGSGYTCGNSTGASGTATGTQTSTTLQDTSQTTWSTNQWNGYFVSITSGTGSGQTRTVASNTASPGDTLTVSSPWTTTPGATSKYSLSFGCLVLYVRNVGSIQIVCDAVYVNNQLALQTQYGSSPATITPAGGTSPGRLSLGIQQLGSIAVPVPFPTSPGTTYTISVSTTRGNVVTVVQTY